MQSVGLSQYLFLALPQALHSQIPLTSSVLWYQGLHQGSLIFPFQPVLITANTVY